MTGQEGAVGRLREAASAIREDYAASETDNGQDDPFMFAVADWLDFAMLGDYRESYVAGRGRTHALAVADAYLATADDTRSGR